MYTAPDFIRVSVKAKDIFSGYDTHCPMDEFRFERNTNPCTAADPRYEIVVNTYVGEGWGLGCYSTQDP